MEALAWFVVVLLMINRRGEASSPSSVAVEAMFVFGDSLSDPGNNNDLVTLSKGNYLPHGIDFPGGATGRFCNGLIGPDHLGNLLGLGLIPAFQNPNTQGSNILNGVNYASSAAGIFNESLAILGERWTFDQQIEQFATKTLPELKSQALRSKEGSKDLTLDEFLGNSLFYSNIGSNDLINYIVANYKYPDLSAYIDLAMTQHRRQLMELHQLGGRKFLIFGLAPIGCLPIAILLFNKNATADCAEQLNQITLRWNAKLTELVQQLNHDLEGAYFLYFDVYNAFLRVTNNPSRYGFKQVHVACCGAGLLNSEFLCLTPKAPVCLNRSEYVFWDSFHATEAMYGVLIRQGFYGTLQDTYPKNVQQLFQPKCREASLSSSGGAEAMFVFGDSLSDPGNNNALMMGYG
ncbi:hypothetical protein Sjap_023080 [Stephania japonica]|uniref:Uncharacterized protein n=1 Tax=Stephania japonica TaxID=461633 RepID=A0AAP0EX76_9MAGN